MAKITLPTITNGQDLANINNNFAQIATALNDKVLYRTNPIGESNTVNQDTDYNGHKAYNLTDVLVNGVSIATALTGITAQVDLGAFVNGTATDAGNITGTETIPVSRGSKLLQTTFTKMAQWVLQTYQGFTASGTGAISRTVQDELRDKVSIKQFGAKGNGVVNDSVAFNAFVTYCASRGAIGIIPAGTYLIDPSTRTFSGSLPFTIQGEGQGVSILKCSNTSSGFIHWIGANGFGFEKLTIDGSFIGSPNIPTNNATLSLENSNNNVLRDIDFINIWRIAVLVFNDHQTNLTNVYGGLQIERVKVFGPSNYISSVGPDAFILADVNNSYIKNCYINNIGRFGYEFKNDSNNCVIADCVAEDVYNPLYFGGDGAHTELGYVKNSQIQNCIVRRAWSGNPIHLTTASNNTIRNISIDQTGVSGGAQTVYITDSSNNNSVTGIDVTGRSTVLSNIVINSNGNVIEFSNIDDGVFTGRGTATSITSDCANNTIIFGNRDSTQQMYLDSYVFNSNSVIDSKLGRQVLNNSSSTSVFNNAGTLVGYITDMTGFRPQIDVVGQLGASGTRWANVFALKATISGALALKVPSTVAGVSPSQSSTDSSLIFNGSTTQTITLLSPATVPGQFLHVKNIAAFAVNSASSNVVPLAGGSAGTSILAATVGKFAVLQSDGTNWVTMMAN